MLEITWFCLVAIMIAGYVVLDGFDIGAGIIHLFVAKTDEERRLVLKSVGPVWDGNEVWLLAGGGTLYFAFPGLYASSFSGFYLPLMMVLWLLMVRGISIEFRSHIDSPAWKPIWDAGFAFSSVLLAVFFGAALGNVVRGVPLDQARRFLPAVMDEFPARRGSRNPRLVHDSGRGIRACHSDSAWRVVGDLQDRGRTECTNQAICRRGPSAWWRC